MQKKPKVRNDKLSKVFCSSKRRKIDFDANFSLVSKVLTPTMNVIRLGFAGRISLISVEKKGALASKESQ